MQCYFRSAITGAAALIASVGAAGAADLYGGAGGIKVTALVLRWQCQRADMPASWYLRLDTAYAMHDAPVIVSQGIDEFVKSGINDTWTIGGGIGRYFTRNVRGDLTVDYRFDTDVHGRNVAPGATFPGTHRFGLESTVMLANLYYDFNRGGWFNPYVGAGLGTVYHQINAGKTQTGGLVAGSDDWHVAGALNAGFTVALHDRLSLDAGYRFLYLGEIKAGGTTDGINIESGPSVEDIHGHEFRVGLRYDIR